MMHDVFRFVWMCDARFVDVFDFCMQHVVDAVGCVMMRCARCGGLTGAPERERERMRERE